MHIEGNVCKAFLRHVFGELDKTRALKEKSRKVCEVCDNLVSWLDDILSIYNKDHNLNINNMFS